MSSYSERWFGQFSENWRDLTTLKGFFGGLFAIVVYSLLFALSLRLAILLPVAEFHPKFDSNTDFESTLIFLLILTSAAIGGGWVVLLHKSNRIQELMKQFSWRFRVIVTWLDTYWLLLLYNRTFAVLAAMLYLFGRGVVHLWIFIAARIVRFIQ